MPCATALVPADAVVLLALESEAHLSRRGGTPLAEVIGFAANCGADHLTAPDRASEIMAMRAALADALRGPNDVDLVVAHGTATRRNDVVEAEALREIFGGAENPPRADGTEVDDGTYDGGLRSDRHRRGRLRAARGFRPAGRSTWTTPTRSARCPASFPSKRPGHSGDAMVNAFAFGGHNAVLVLRRA
jgi:3-oxoacyl-(acyl-carrier-protein) synthase